MLPQPKETTLDVARNQAWIVPSRDDLRPYRGLLLRTALSEMHWDLLPSIRPLTYRKVDP
jgi:hypothetical protein